MNLHRVFAVLLVAFGCASLACEHPPPLSPAAATVRTDDGRSIEQCTTLGLVSAKTAVGTLSPDPPEQFTTPQLRDRVAERGGNYLETMPVTCNRNEPCVQSGIAYRCPVSA